MNYHLSQIPERTLKPRSNGMTMVMDKGLSPREVEDFIEVAGPFVDIVKLGWATSYVTPVLEKKLAIEKEVSENKQIFNSIKSEQIRGITVRRRNKEINFKDKSIIYLIY